MTALNEKIESEPIKISHISWLGFTLLASLGVDKIFEQDGFKNITILANEEFWYDKNGSERIKLITNSDLSVIVIPIKNAEIQKRNNARKIEDLRSKISNHKAELRSIVRQEGTSGAYYDKLNLIRGLEGEIGELTKVSK